MRLSESYRLGLARQQCFGCAKHPRLTGIVGNGQVNLYLSAVFIQYINSLTPGRGSETLTPGGDQVDSKMVFQNINIIIPLYGFQ